MDGVIIVDKPSGKTSFDVIRDIKKSIAVKKIGHAGTLDPLATGVLPVCIGEATKLIRFFLNDDKEYRATLLLGVETETLDREGTVTARRDVALDESCIDDVFAGLVGKIEQTPPRYSAVKFRGRPLYEWTRRGIDVYRRPRVVEIHRISVEDVTIPYITFTVSCSKGTYIRTLGEEIGRRLGCGACLHSLRRVRSGRFEIGQALSLEGYDRREKAERLRRAFIPLAEAIPDFIPLLVDEEAVARIRQGCQPDARMFVARDLSMVGGGDVVKLITEAGDVVAVAEIIVPGCEVSQYDEKSPVARILRVFNG
ncbi:MAG: tRNA pseudouridine(55) synthase TruB [Deltaproteobacteria bacterium]|nr:tRNA pseudouridine(55) synthase TruB [Deltaproteobacteria bacterium]